jgi:hypothetical protein
MTTTGETVRFEIKCPADPLGFAVQWRATQNGELLGYFTSRETAERWVQSIARRYDKTSILIN